jgi:hypothetical protein
VPSSRGCRYPGVAARRGQGGADAQVRRIRASSPAAHLLNRDLLAGLRGPWHLLPPGGTTRTGDPSSNPGDPIHNEFNLASAQISST